STTFSRSLVFLVVTSQNHMVLYIVRYIALFLSLDHIVKRFYRIYTVLCPRCGEETSSLYGGEKKYCPECYTDVNSLADIPDEIEIETCSVCGRMRHKGEVDRGLQHRGSTQ
ncbi:hypothetical protein HRED_08735, partial [Candidatus Haloredivivus sp. G17]